MENIQLALFEMLTRLPELSAYRDLLRAPIDTAARAELIAIANDEKCLPNLYETWEIDGTLTIAEAEQLSVLRMKQASGVEVSLSLPPSAILLKGASMQRYYPAGICRFSLDVDVLISNFSDMATIHAAVKPLGYLLDGAGQYWMPRRGRLNEGFGSYRYWTPDGAESTVSIEIQVGGFPIDRRRILRDSELRTGATLIGGHRCMGLDPTRQLLLILVDYGIRRGPITVRHIADLYHLLRQTVECIEWNAITGLVPELGIANGLRKLAAAIQRHGLVPYLALGRLQEMIDGVLHAPAVQVRKRRALTQWGASVLKTAFDKTAERRSDDALARIAHSSALVSFILSGGERVFGVALSTKGSEAPMLLRIGRNLYFSCGTGLFLLSMVDLTDDARRKKFDALRGRTDVVVLSRWEEAKC